MNSQTLLGLVDATLDGLPGLADHLKLKYGREGEAVDYWKSILEAHPHLDAERVPYAMGLEAGVDFGVINVDALEKMQVWVTAGPWDVDVGERFAAAVAEAKESLEEDYVRVAASMAAKTVAHAMSAAEDLKQLRDLAIKGVEIPSILTAARESAFAQMNATLSTNQVHAGNTRMNDALLFLFGEEVSKYTPSLFKESVSTQSSATKKALVKIGKRFVVARFLGAVDPVGAVFEDVLMAMGDEFSRPEAVGVVPTCVPSPSVPGARVPQAVFAGELDGDEVGEGMWQLVLNVVGELFDLVNSLLGIDSNFRRDVAVLAAMLQEGPVDTALSRAIDDQLGAGGIVFDIVDGGTFENGLAGTGSSGAAAFAEALLSVGLTSGILLGYLLLTVPARRVFRNVSGAALLYGTAWLVFAAASFAGSRSSDWAPIVESSYRIATVMQAMASMIVTANFLVAFFFEIPEGRASVFRTIAAAPWFVLSSAYTMAMTAETEWSVGGVAVWLNQLFAGAVAEGADATSNLFVGSDALLTGFYIVAGIQAFLVLNDVFKRASGGVQSSRAVVGLGLLSGLSVILRGAPGPGMNKLTDAVAAASASNDPKEAWGVMRETLKDLRPLDRPGPGDTRFHLMPRLGLLPRSIHHTDKYTMFNWFGPMLSGAAFAYSIPGVDTSSISFLLATSASVATLVLLQRVRNEFGPGRTFLDATADWLFSVAGPLGEAPKVVLRSRQGSSAPRSVTINNTQTINNVQINVGSGELMEWVLWFMSRGQYQRRARDRLELRADASVLLMRTTAAHASGMRTPGMLVHPSLR